MDTNYLLGLVLLALLGASPTQAIDAGFELHFETEANVYRQVPVYFDRPLPSWVSGHLVSTFLSIIL